MAESLQSVVIFNILTYFLKTLHKSKQSDKCPHILLFGNLKTQVYEFCGIECMNVLFQVAN